MILSILCITDDVSLQKSDVGVVSIAAVMTHQYEQAAQTDPWPAAKDTDDNSSSDSESVVSSSAASSSAKQTAPAHSASAGGPAALPTKAPRQLSQEETDSLLHSDDFAVFVRNASLAVRSALDTPQSGAESLLSLLRGRGAATAASDSDSALLSAVATVPADTSSGPTARLTPAPAGCVLRSLFPCPHEDSSFVAVWTPVGNTGGAQGSSDSGGSDAWSVSDTSAQSSGIDSHLELWSLSDMAAPQTVLTLPSGTVTCAIWHPFAPHCILAGTASGQLASWDIRGLTSAPTQLSPLGGGSGKVQGHVYPITGVAVPGTHNTHSIVSVSLDGRMCLWGDSTLYAPSAGSLLSGPRAVILATEAAAAMDIDGQSSAGRVPPPCAVRTVPLAAVSLSPVPTDPSSLLVGTQDGGVFRIALSPQGEASVAAVLASAGDPFGAQAGFSQASSFWGGASQATQGGAKAVPAGHDGTVTGMVHHPGHWESPLLGDVFVTGGSDWTVRLWSPRLSPGPLMCVHGPSSAVRGVTWCPRVSHPGLVSACHGDGSVCVWDVQQAAKHGIAARTAAHFQTPQGTAAVHALWLQGNMRDAPPLVVADSAGAFHVLDSSPALAKGGSGAGANSLLDTLLALAPKQTTSSTV